MNKKMGILESLTCIACEKDIPSLNKITELLGGSMLLILDDLMLVTTKSHENLGKLNSLAIRDCQDVLNGKGKLRQVKSNSKNMVMFDNKDNQQNWHLIFHNRKINQQADVFKDAYNYLVLDNDPKNSDNTRIKSVFMIIYLIFILTEITFNKSFIGLLHFSQSVSLIFLVKINNFQLSNITFLA